MSTFKNTIEFSDLRVLFFGWILFKILGNVKPESKT